MTDKEESGKNIGSSLFHQSDKEEMMANFAEQFKDKVGAIHEHFDKNKDGFLNFEELSALQLCTSGQILDSNMYVYLCKGLDCDPNKGLSLSGLKLTYASDGTSLDGDYDKIFSKKTEKDTKKKEKVEKEEEIFEVGDGGVDISPSQS